MESLHEQIVAMKKKINEKKQEVPEDIGNYLLKNLRVPYKNSRGKMSERKLYDANDLVKHFDISLKPKYDSLKSGIKKSAPSASTKSNKSKTSTK